MMLLTAAGLLTARDLGQAIEVETTDGKRITGQLQTIRHQAELADVRTFDSPVPVYEVTGRTVGLRVADKWAAYVDANHMVLIGRTAE